MDKNIIKTDIAVIGGGASGICSAISAKITNKNLNVVILEKLSRTGTKILSTGNGRCNLGNKNISPKFYHGSIKNYMNILQNTDTEDFFNFMGMMCRTDSEGRIYPYSNKASSVLDALRISIKNLCISEICGFDVKSIEKSGNSFIIKSENRTVYAKKIIVSSGGFSAPSLGTDGKLIKIISENHRITNVYPSLCPLNYKNPEEYKSLSGIRAKVKVSAKSDSELGEIQFTSTALSGICIFNLSYLKPRSIKIDFMPDKDFQNVLEYLICLKKIRNNCTLEEYLSGIFAKNLGSYLVKKSTGKSISEKVSGLNSNDIKSISGAIKSTVIDTVPTNKWNSSQVTAGGISGSEVDENLQSLRCFGMYFSGEILDIDGKCGGYNLMWAWSSGIWAGKKCAEGLKKNDKTK